MSDNDPLSVRLAGIDLRNPIILAAGTAATLDELGDALDLSRVGALVTKSITLQPRDGNRAWRVVDTRAGMLNAVGLANPGLADFLAHVAPRIPSVPTVVLASVAGFSVDEYVRTAAGLGGVESIPGIELNVSCPNVRGGAEFGADPALLAELVRAVRPVLPRTRLFVKLSPVVTAPPGAALVDLARAAVSAGADGLTIANTVPAMAIDITTRRARLSNITGGLSGPAIHPIAVKLVYDAARALPGVPIIGAGGVMCWQDAAEFVLAGAAAVEVGTALFADPRAPAVIARGLARWVHRQGARGIADLVGGVKPPIDPTADGPGEPGGGLASD